MTPLSPARHVAPNQSADMSAHSKKISSHRTAWKNGTLFRHAGSLGWA